MYKVIIVDNEESVRERLLNLLKKVNDNFEVIGSYENGFDALISGVPLNPDLLITDIKMPYIDGIDLIKRAKLELPLLQSIIISGYDSFDYAKQAISLGVIGYITKPINFEDLNEALTKAKIDLDKKLNIDKNIESLQKQADSALKMLQENDLNKLISLKEIPENFIDKLNIDKINLDYQYITLACIDFDDENYDITFTQNELVSLYLEKFIDEELSNLDLNFLTFSNSLETNLLMLSNTKIDKEKLQESLLRVVNKIKKACKTSISIGISEIIDTSKYKDKYRGVSFRMLYRHAKRTLEYRTILGSNMVMFFEDVDNTSSSTGKIDENEYKVLGFEILYGHIDEVFKKLENIMHRVTLESFKDTYYFVLNNVLDSILNSCVNLSVLYKEYMSHIEIIHRVFDAKTSDTAILLLKELILKIDEINKRSRQSKVETAFNQIKIFIENNYKNPLLSLEDVAKELGYSVSYISAIFKKNNTSFTKYLTDIRMNASLPLLASSNEKLITIASEVGYEDPYYFSHCFKKYFGMSPLDYRKK
ncbi:MAG: response regulator [Firmicutes bacterium]|uniref:Response regulator n=1 Tax=Candidatus Onthovivens merdipullorum TaxID=2840889 RepID=A0A9D9DGU1_9BACL|nr:response regulator [Candidatus Onthovivens merdipullorum]